MALPDQTPKPADSGTHSSLLESSFLAGQEKLQMHSYHQAKILFHAALLHAPWFAPAAINLGYAHQMLGELDDALACYRLGILLDPCCLEGYINLGAVLISRKRWNEAELLLRKAIELRPESSSAHSNLGVLMAGLEHDAEAERELALSLQLDPKHGEAHVNLAYVLLRQGRFREGWRHLQERPGRFNAIQAPGIACWEGQNVGGRALLIIPEGGFGDMIQFCRYVPILKQLGASRVDLLTTRPLQSLLLSVEGVGQVLTPETLPYSDRTAWDWWCPLLSLPYHLDTNESNIPCNSPYLKAPSRKLHEWKLRIRALTRLPKGKRTLRVGANFKGNPAHENDLDRSLKGRRALYSIASVPNVVCFNLERGPRLVSRKISTLHSVGSRIMDFGDTAALIEQLDLVISVDSAVAHLAGALGKPCWLLLPKYKTDWRWMKERSDSPWYPQVSLYRQRQIGQWKPTISALVANLRYRAREPKKLRLGGA